MPDYICLCNNDSLDTMTWPEKRRKGGAEKGGEERLKRKGRKTESVCHEGSSLSRESEGFELCRPWPAVESSCPPGLVCCCCCLCCCCWWYWFCTASCSKKPDHSSANDSLREFVADGKSDTRLDVLGSRANGVGAWGGEEVAVATEDR